MFAVEFSEYGEPDVLRLGEAPEPHAGPGQIRVQVRAASINPIDWKVLAGYMAGGAPLQGAGHLGFDAAGVVDEVGEGVSDVAVGDDVFGLGQDTQAEYAVLTAGRGGRMDLSFRRIPFDVGAYRTIIGASGTPHAAALLAQYED